MHGRNPHDGHTRDVFKVEEEEEDSYITLKNSPTVHLSHGNLLKIRIKYQQHAFPKKDCFPVDIFDKELKEKYYAKLKEKK